MARPRMNDEVSPANLVARMKPGNTYSVPQLAAKLHVPAASIRPMLEQMVKDGVIEPSAARPSVSGFRRPKEHEVTEADDVDMSVAAPRIPIIPAGSLTGYDAEFARRVALCMTVRGAR